MSFITNYTINVIKISFREFRRSLEELKNTKKIIKFKFEPPIIHIACRNLEDASKIVEEAQNSGFKRSGLINWKKNIFVELNSTEKFEFPIIEKREILVNDRFLKLILKNSNQKFEKGWKKIRQLEKRIK